MTSEDSDDSSELKSQESNLGFKRNRDRRTPSDKKGNSLATSDHKA